jgi:hypothetical protein
MIYVSKNKLFPVLDGDDVIRIFLAEMAPRKRPKPGAYAEPEDVDAPALDQMFEEEMTEKMAVRAHKIQQARAHAPLPETDSEPEEELDLVVDAPYTDYSEDEMDEALKDMAREDLQNKLNARREAELSPPTMPLDMPDVPRGKPGAGYVSDSSVYPESDYETDWTNRMERRVGKLHGHLEAIQEDEDEDSEGEHILVEFDPDWTAPLAEEPKWGKERYIRDPNDERDGWALSMVGVAFVFLYIANYMPS